MRNDSHGIAVVSTHPCDRHMQRCVETLILLTSLSFPLGTCVHGKYWCRKRNSTDKAAACNCDVDSPSQNWGFCPVLEVLTQKCWRTRQCKAKTKDDGSVSWVRMVLLKIQWALWAQRKKQYLRGCLPPLQLPFTLANAYQHWTFKTFLKSMT